MALLLLSFVLCCFFVLRLLRVISTLLSGQEVLDVFLRGNYCLYEHEIVDTCGSDRPGDTCRDKFNTAFSKGTLIYRRKNCCYNLLD